MFIYGHKNNLFTLIRTKVNMTFTPFSLPTDPNAQILLNTALSIQLQGTSTPLATADLQNRPGWYYNSALQTDTLTWTVFNGTNQDFTLGDVQNLTLTATHDNTPTNKCYMAITSPFSRIVYENNNVDLIVGEKCLFYTNTIPQNPDNLRLVQLNLVTKIGPCLPDEQLMTITLEGTNATLFPDVLLVCVENIGFQLNPDQVPVIVNLQTDQTVNVSITGFATEVTLSNLNNKIHNDTVHTNAIQVEVKNTTSIPVSNSALTSLTFSGNSLNVDVTNTVPVSNSALTSLTFSGTSLNVDVTNTVPVTNSSLAALTFSGTSLNVDVTNTVPVTNSSLAALTFSGTSLNVDVTNTVPVTNSSLAALTFSGNSLNVDVTNTVPISNSALTNMTFTGGSLNVIFPTTTPIPTSLPALNYDAFGRFRVSNPFTLFDSNFRYGDNGLWATSSTGGATYTFNSSQGLMDLTVSGTSSSEVIRETYRVFSYQPGKSLLVMNSFAGTTVAGVQQRIGYFGAQNGVYFQINGNGTCSFVKRSYITGTTVDSPVLQSAWNGDKLNGTGASGYTLDLSKPQLSWMDFEWLGVGTVRCGFIINEKFILCHSFNWANDPASTPSTYMTTASLPIRYEIINNGGAGGTLKQTCSTVISEGGYELAGTQLSVATALTTPVATGTTPVPIISLRLTSGKLDAVVIMTAMNIVPAGSATTTYYWQIIRGGTTTGGNWIIPAFTGSSIDYNVFPTAGTITGGVCMASGFFSASNQSKGGIDLLKEAVFKFQLLRNGLTTTPIELTIVCSSITGTNASVFASIDWEEVTR